MKWRVVYEDEKGNCRVIVPAEDYQRQGETEEEALERLLKAALPIPVNGIVALIVPSEKIPTDFTFRDAWRFGDLEEPVKFDLEVCKRIHRERLKKAIEKKLAQLSDELERAIEDDHLPRQVAAKRTKKIMRTMHEMDLSHCKTPDDVKKTVPKELHDVWSFYEIV